MVVALLATCALAAPAGAAPPRVPARPVTTIAIVGDAAINPLHVEFRTRDGRDPAYPAGMPKPVRVTLPKGSFADAMATLAAGPLGNPKAGTLYAVAGTRLLVYATPGSGSLVAPGDGRLHGTGTAASAAGSRTGTSPDSLVVFVPRTTAAAYGWLAAQRWVDVASTSVYSIPTTEQCQGAAEARAMHQRGGLLFSSSGNTYDYVEPFSVPNGLPEVFQVGGVDAAGRTWLPPHPGEESPFFAAGSVVRPYETGARYSFRAASGDSRDGTQPFGGTSGATPTVAGYAAELIAEARRLLRSPGGRRRGPLADGRFTRDELVALLHATATPFEAPGTHRYALEGYGATGATSHALALKVLRGQATAPARAAEDAEHARAESLRAAHTARC